MEKHGSLSKTFDFGKSFVARTFGHEDPAISRESDNNEIQPTCTEVFWIGDEYQHITEDLKYKIYPLGFLQKVFMTFEYPLSSIMAEIISYISTAMILLSVSGVILSTIPGLQHTPSTCHAPACDNDPTLCPGTMICAPREANAFTTIDVITVSFFTLDLGIRVCLCGIMPTRLSGTVPDDWEARQQERIESSKKPKEQPKYGMKEIYLRYILSLHTAIDLLSIIPTFIYMSGGRSDARKLILARVLRLLRIFRVMRINQRGRMIVHLVNKTLSRSREAIAILLFYVGIVVIFFATLVFTVEHGDFIVNEDYPDGVYLRPDGYGGKAISPFNSIPTTIYYIMITLTTIGYGDICPTTIVGRAFASTLALISILVLALPITVIGNNFSIEYEKYEAKISAMNEIVKSKKNRVKHVIKKGFQERRGSFFSDSYFTSTNRESDASTVDIVNTPSEKIIYDNSLGEDKSNNEDESMNEVVPSPKESQKASQKKDKSVRFDHRTISYDEGEGDASSKSSSSKASKIRTSKRNVLSLMAFPHITDQSFNKLDDKIMDVEMTTSRQSSGRNGRAVNMLEDSKPDDDDISFINEMMQSPRENTRGLRRSPYNTESPASSVSNISKSRSEQMGAFLKKMSSVVIGSRDAIKEGSLISEEVGEEEEEETIEVMRSRRGHSNMFRRARQADERIPLDDLQRLSMDSLLNLDHKSLAEAFLEMRKYYNEQENWRKQVQSVVMKFPHET